MADIHARVPDDLFEAARAAAGLPEAASAPQVVRYSLAVASGWPELAARVAAGPTREGKGTANE